MRFLATAALSAGLVVAQSEKGTIQITVVDSKHAPMAARFSIEKAGEPGFVPPDIAQSPGGGYAVVLPRGRYNLVIGMPFFETEVIRGIALSAGETRVLQPLELAFEGMFSCALTRPHYYAALAGSDVGSLTGFLFDRETGAPLGGGSVELYAPRVGKIATSVTDADGRFSFAGVPARADYWIHTARPGYFDDEFTAIIVQSGFQTVYEQIGLESCTPGRCDPSLKTIRVLGGCE